MKIIVIMLSKAAGGIEQAAFDYCEGLRDIGHDVTAIIHPDSWIRIHMQSSNINLRFLPNFSEYDVFAWWRLRRIINYLAPDAVITHANRAIGIAMRALKLRKFPLIGVVNNYSISRYKKADLVFAPTNDLVRALIASGISENRIFHIPNMIKCDFLSDSFPSNLLDKKHTKETLVIGAIGRFVKKKGFDYYIEALSLLKQRGISFKAVLGGSGEEELALKQLAVEKNLGDLLEFSGWIENRKEFYSSIDIFCLPSLHEPFGIVLLEAFANAVPVVSANSEGPSEIITPDYDAILVEKANANQLADALEKLINNSELRKNLATKALEKVKEKYDQKIIAKKIETAISTKWQIIL